MYVCQIFVVQGSIADLPINFGKLFSFFGKYKKNQ